MPSLSKTLALALAVPSLFATDSLLAAGVWYLFLPPISSINSSTQFPSFKVLDDQPLPKWLRQDSFYSEKQCERAKDVMENAEERRYHEDMDELQKHPQYVADDPQEARRIYEHAQYSRAEAIAADSGLCIGSNDPRLAK